MDRRTFLAGAAALALGGHRMPDPSVPGNLADRLRRLEQRLTALEMSPQLVLSSVREGGLNIYDDSGVKAARLGTSSVAPDQAGLELLDSGGNVLLHVGRVGADGNEVSLRGVGAGGGFGVTVGRFPDQINALGEYVTGAQVLDEFLLPVMQVSSEEAWQRPLIPVHARKADDFYQLNSGSYVPTWRATAQGLYCRYAYIQVVAATDAATTADVRVTHGTGTSAAQSVAAGSAGTTLTWRWDMAGSNIVDHTFTVEARRTGGAGNVRVYDPVICLGRPDGTVTNTGI